MVFALPWDQEQGKDVQSIHLFIILAVLANVMKQKNKHRAYKTRKGEIELFLFTDNTKVYVENLKNSTHTHTKESQYLSVSLARL